MECLYAQHIEATARGRFAHCAGALAPLGALTPYCNAARAASVLFLLLTFAGLTPNYNRYNTNMIMDSSVTIGLDLGGTQLKYGIVDTSGQLLWHAQRPSRSDQNRAQVEQNLVEAIAESRRQAARQGRTVVAVGLGSPGIIDCDEGLVIGGADQLPDWERLPIGHQLTLASGLPVFVDNDANLMGWGEYHYGNNSNCHHLVFLTIGTGIGGAIILNGSLYRGHRFAAGELGVLPMEYRGQRGNWEDFASTAALVRHYQQLTQSPEPTDGKYIFTQYRKGEAHARTAVEEHIRLMGLGLGAYMNIFNPERIIIGGGISESGSDYIEALGRSARQYALPPCSEGVEVVGARLGNRAGLMGAAHFAASRIGLLSHSV